MAVTVQIDTREQYPLDIEGYPTEVVGLPVGDYGVAGFSDWSNPAFIVERKSLDDLVSSLTQGRARFMREIEKMRAFRCAVILIEADRTEVEILAYRSARVRSRSAPLGATYRLGSQLNRHFR